jgi:hypothetical protein
VVGDAPAAAGSPIAMIGVDLDGLALRHEDRGDLRHGRGQLDEDLAVSISTTTSLILTCRRP